MTRLLIETEGVIISPDTPVIKHNPDPIDEYIVIVNLPEDWEEVHNYIINENNIDGIPNRKVTCSNTQEFSLRSAVYEMSAEEAELTKTHPKVEDVRLNPDKYYEMSSPETIRYKKVIAFSKPKITAALDSEDISHTNGKRSNWSHLFVNSSPSSKPFQGSDISDTTKVDRDITYSLTGKNVDSVIIDSGVGYLHPEFKNEDGTYRVKDIFLDGPYKVDPEYFDSNGYTYTKVVDGITLGVGIETSRAREWWTTSSSRSAAFQSLGTVSLSSLYTLGHVATKSSNSNSNQLIDGHGTACASQIGGKTFGLAFESNLWNIRIALTGAGGYVSSSVALNALAIWHNAKKIAFDDPDPTLVNNSYGSSSSTGNTNGVNYIHGYRGEIQTYNGTGDNATPPSNSGACRNHKFFKYGSLSYSYNGTGQYLPSGSATNSGAENAIAAGCIMVASAGNKNQKISTYDDIDYDNWYSNSSNFICRAGGVQKGFSGNDERKKGTIRVGALDCGVEPTNASNPYAVRKVCYSSNGPMINIWAPAEYTMAAGYGAASYEDYAREDDAGFYDTWFNGTSSASPNTCSVIALYLESNRGANQADVHDWLDRYGSVEIDLYDDEDVDSSYYWSQANDSGWSAPSGQCRNYRGNSSLRGAPKRVLKNPFATDGQPSISGVEVSGISFSQS
tara:strand:- start:874 stop:2898 length:2025 start_codon:yes stop_codon:yes gene_type:complete